LLLFTFLYNNKVTKTLRKLLKYLVLGVLGMVGLVLISAIAINKRLPEPEYGPDGDRLANEMLESLDFEAWQNINFIQWTSYGKHSYIWDKKNNVANIKWDNYEVVLNLDSKSGVVYEYKHQLTGEEKSEIIEKAWEYWCNDSFWLCAPYKVFDPGTKRAVVKQKDGSEALMVSFMKGGSTPGDSYLWILDENKRPVSWRMWVQKLPVGGVPTSWESWIDLPGGATVASLHKVSIIDIELTNIQASQYLKDLDLDNKVFSIP
jgi:hypothetical protein